MKRKVTGGMGVNAYRVLAEAVEAGVRRGWHRAHKYCESPTQEQICDEMQSCIMGEVCEWFDFDGGGGWTI